MTHAQDLVTHIQCQFNYDDNTMTSDIIDTNSITNVKIFLSFLPTPLHFHAHKTHTHTHICVTQKKIWFQRQ